MKSWNDALPRKIIIFWSIFDGFFPYTLFHCALSISTNFLSFSFLTLLLCLLCLSFIPLHYSSTPMELSIENIVLWLFHFEINFHIIPRSDFWLKNRSVSDMGSLIKEEHISLVRSECGWPIEKYKIPAPIVTSLNFTYLYISTTPQILKLKILKV